MEYEAVIALEIHAHLKTARKQYCDCPVVNTRELADANRYVCPVCLGHPGVLPVLNRESVILAMMLGIRLHADIARHSIFARKHYFYPDLPKGYQITQYQTPLVEGGELEFLVDGEMRTAQLERAHLEEDTAKIFYQDDGSILLDYNRAGVPLLEIVTKPVFRSAAEAVAYAEELRQVLRKLGVSDANMEEGSFRCEPNISVRPVGSDELRTKCEIKNLNSFAVIRKSLDAEIARQIALYEDDGEVQHCTLRWDEEHARTVPMRIKETQADYRYFDEPDLPPLVLTDDDFAEARRRYESAMFTLEWDGKEHRFAPGTARLTRFFLDNTELRESEVAVLLEDEDALRLLFASNEISGAFRECANWVLMEYRPRRAEAEGNITPQHIADIVALRADAKLNSTQAKEVFALCFERGISASDAVSELGFDQVVSESDLQEICAQVIADNDKIIADIRKGKEQAVRALLGQVMKLTRGKAKPDEALAELKRQLGM
ncbi:Asp-tRNA(Asn)/Glu-tRNA(Gln) amidotransferase subunit GatB [bacterium]|nr:Asp-tRNA(Asn)/Glu-tRNA(Gln) amidotransferase subunit GatB [bacterium]